MSETNKFSATSNSCYKNSSANLFNQLRHLAAEVESGIQVLQSELDSKRNRGFGDTEHVQAINFLLHTKKDMADLRHKATEKKVEFSQESAKIGRVHELIKTVMAVQSKRLENVESYMEKYGYKRPIFASEAKAKTEVGEGDNARKNGCSNVSNCDDDDDNESEATENDSFTNCGLDDCVQDDGPKTPPSQISDKPTNSNIMRTPRLEDFYKDLSEETILLIKHGTRCKSQDESSTKQNTTVKESTYCSDAAEKPTDSNIMRTPKLEDLYKNLSEETVFLIKRGTQGKSQDESSAKQHAAMRESYFYSSTNPLSLKNEIQTERKIGESTASLADILAVNHGQVETSMGKGYTFETSKMYTTTQLTPEMPKLLTPAFDLKRVTMVEGFCFSNNNFPSSHSKIKHEQQMPEPPVLNTGMSTFNTHSKKFETSKRNHCAPTTPETPKLLTPGFKWKNFSSREADIAIISNSETPDLLASKFKATTTVKTPEAPILRMPGFKLSSVVNPEERQRGKTACSLFSTPPTPELMTCELKRHDLPLYAIASGSKENMQSSKTNCFSKSDAPKLCSRNLHSKYSARNSNK